MSSRSNRSKYITVRNISGRFEVSWDYQSAPRKLTSLAISERLDGYIDGFIDGLLVALEVPEKHIHRVSSSKCTVGELEGHVALRLAKTLTDLFQPFTELEREVTTTHPVPQTIRDGGRDVKILNLVQPKVCISHTVCWSTARG